MILSIKIISGPNGVPDGIISPEYDRVLLGGSLPRFLYGEICLWGIRVLMFLPFFQGIGKQTVSVGKRYGRTVTRRLWKYTGID